MEFTYALEEIRHLHPDPVPDVGVVEAVLVFGGQKRQDRIAKLIEPDLEDSVARAAKDVSTDAEASGPFRAQAWDEEVKIEDVPRLDGGPGGERFDFLGQGRPEIVMGRPQGRDLVIIKNGVRDGIHDGRTLESPARKFDLREEIFAGFRQEMDFESLGRFRLLRPGDVGGSHVPDAERPKGITEAGASEDVEDDVLQTVDAEIAGVEVHIFGITDALEEKAQVRASLDGDCLGIELPAEATQKFQMENLPKLERGKDELFHIRIVV
jgi:hypothetical protein